MNTFLKAEEKLYSLHVRLKCIYTVKKGMMEHLQLMMWHICLNADANCSSSITYVQWVMITTQQRLLTDTCINGYVAKIEC